MAARGTAVTVSVLAPNGRRQTVKVGPSTPLLQILEEVCRKQNFSPEDYDLKFQRTVLDLSLQWRFANLPNNAKLEMVTTSRQRAPETENMVRIALQLEDGSRLQSTLGCNQTVWELLSQFPQTRVLDTQMQDSTPVCIYMRDEIIGEASLKATTLKSLGLTGGTAIIRYIQKKPQRSNEDETTEMEVAYGDQLSETQSKISPMKLPSNQVVDISMSEGEEIKFTKETPGTSSQDTSVKQQEKAVDSNVEVGKGVLIQGSTAKQEEEVMESKMEMGKGASIQGSTVKQKEKALGSKVLMGKSSSTTEQIKEEKLKPVKSPESQPGPSVEQAECSSKEMKPTTSTSLAQQSTFVPFSGGGQRLGGSGTELKERDKLLKSSLQMSVSSPGGSPKIKKPKTKQEGHSEASQSVERESLVYHMDMDDPLRDEAAKELGKELPEEFFEVTVDDIRKRFSQLKSERQHFEEAPLMTKALREAQSQEKLQRYPKVVLRVQFPDRYVLQGFFQPSETVGSVKEFVKKHLASPDLPFYLFFAPPKTVLEDSSATLFQANLFPAAVIYFGSTVRRDCYLRPEFLEFIVPPSRADIAVASAMTPSSSPSAPETASLTLGGPNTVANVSSTSAAAPVVSDQEANAEAPKPTRTDPSKVPKWLKLPGKR